LPLWQQQQNSIVYGKLYNRIVGKKTKQKVDTNKIAYLLAFEHDLATIESTL